MDPQRQHREWLLQATHNQLLTEVDNREYMIKVIHHQEVMPNLFPVDMPLLQDIPSRIIIITFLEPIYKLTLIPPVLVDVPLYLRQEQSPEDLQANSMVPLLHIPREIATLTTMPNRPLQCRLLSTRLTQQTRTMVVVRTSTRLFSNFCLPQMRSL